MRTALESSCQGHIPETKDLMGHWVTPTPRLKEDEARPRLAGEAAYPRAEERG